MSAATPNPDLIVRSRFSVAGQAQLQDGSVEYGVSYERDSKRSFEELRKDLAPLGLVPWLTGDKEDCRLLVAKAQARSRRNSGVTTLMALLASVSVIVFAILEGDVYATYAPGIPYYAVLALYASAVGVVLAAHELGHRLRSRRAGAAPPATYLIPGIPTVTSFLPVLGMASTQKEPAVNRDHLFDLMVAGPLVALLASVLLYAVGEFVAVQSSLSVQGATAAGSFWAVGQVSPSLLQRVIDALAAPSVRSAAPGLATLSPVEDAAAVGFMLSIVSLFPLAGFEGGYAFAAAFGGRASRLASYAGAVALICIDTPRYWALAMVVLLLAGRPPDLRLYDEVSGISRWRKVILVAAVVLAILSVPVPVNLAAFPLG